MSKARLLVVDDERSILTSLKRFFRKHHYDVVTSPTSSEAKQLIREQRFDLVLTDMRIEGKEDGLEIVDLAKSVDPICQVIVMTGYGTLSNAVAAMRKGAFTYVEKPMRMEDLLPIFDRALEHRQLRQDKEFLQEELDHRFGSGNMIGEHPTMKKLREMIQRVARTDSTVLILGENGTGKELVARAIHQLSARRDRLLVPVNCAAIPGELLESELFGHVKGAFTGAHRNKVGRFEIARGGTLFLDEIGDMPVPLQAKLLRVLQEGVYEPVGSTRQLKLEARVLAATNQNLESKIAEGSFREDLYYRLNVIPITVPPLRERASDIPLLVDHFIRKYAKRYRARVKSMDKAGLDALTGYHWPGNVRELENLVQRLVVLNPDKRVLGFDELPPPYCAGSGGPTPTKVGDELSLTLPEGGIDLKALLTRIEDTLIDQALERTGGNKNQAARLLGLKRTTLVEKLKKRARRAYREQSRTQGKTAEELLLEDL